MGRVVEIGKKGPYTGKRLFEILCNLRNFGVGRIVQRISIADKAEKGPNFYRIIKAAPQMDRDLAFGTVWAEEIRNGRKIPFMVKLNTTLPDFRLVFKHDESKLNVNSTFPVLGNSSSDDIHLKRNYYVPPIMAEFLNRHQTGNVSVYRHGLNKNIDGFDQLMLNKFKIPYVYEFDEYDQVCRKVYEEN